jgi:hypothetical protein
MDIDSEQFPLEEEDKAMRQSEWRWIYKDCKVFRALIEHIEVATGEISTNARETDCSLQF